MLVVRELDFDYQDKPLLKGIHFNLDAGSLLHLRGGNGTGKTTLLKLIAGIYRPAQGEIQFNGENIEFHRADYQRQLCFMGHKTGINPYLTIKENCLFDLHYPSRCKLKELAAIFNLEDYWDVPCALLSAGQKRQVGLLRLWMSEAPLWLLDEPFVALDERSLSTLMSKIELHLKEGGAVLMTSHQALPLELAEYQEYVL